MDEVRATPETKSDDRLTEPVGVCSVVGAHIVTIRETVVLRRRVGDEFVAD